MSRRGSSSNDHTIAIVALVVLLALVVFILFELSRAVGAVFGLISALLLSQALWVGLGAGVGISALVRRKLIARSLQLEQENRQLKALVEQLHATVDQYIESSDARPRQPGQRAAAALEPGDGTTPVPST